MSARRVAPALLAAAVALGGCAVTAPPAPAVQTDVPAAWSQGLAPPPQAAAPAAPAPARASSDWWSAFGDTELVALIDAALEANTDIGTARANLQRALALRDVASAGLRPTLAVSGSGQRARSGAAGSTHRVELGLDASWEPDLFGANAHGAQAAQADARASAATLEALRVSIAAEAALDYLSLRSAQARLAIAERNLAAQQQTLQITDWRSQAGLASSLELLQSRSAVEQTRASLPVLTQAAAEARHALAVLTGQPPAALDERLTTVRALPQPATGLTVGVPATTLLQRPDVLAAEQQWQAAAERVAQADAQRRPQLRLSASLGWAALTLGSLGSQPALVSLLGSVSQPLFDGGQLKAQLAAQEASLAAAEQAWRARVLVALQEAEDAISAVNTSTERRAALAAASSSARAAADLAQQRYRSGLVDFQTVLETQRTLLGVEENLAVAEAAVASGHVRLYKALGGGWTRQAQLSQPQEKTP